MSAAPKDNAKPLSVFERHIQVGGFPVGKGSSMTLYAVSCVKGEHRAIELHTSYRSGASICVSLIVSEAVDLAGVLQEAIEVARTLGEAAAQKWQRYEESRAAAEQTQGGAE